MSKKHKHEEHANHERWLVSYADFITLLFAFFVVLFSSSQVDRSKTKKMALAIESAFDKFSIFKSQSGDQMDSNSMGGSGGNAKRYREFIVNNDTEGSILLAPEFSDLEETALAPTGDTTLSQNTGWVSSQEQAMARVQKKIMTLLNTKKIKGRIEMIQDPRGIVIRVEEAALFMAGADQLSPESESVLKVIGSMIASIPNEIRIEGHTDNQAVTENYVSNWELSLARATFVLKWILSHFDINPARLSVVGYGEYRPIVKSDDGVGKLKNRRVEIVIVPLVPPPKEAQGFHRASVETTEFPFQEKP